MTEPNIEEIPSPPKVETKPEPVTVPEPAPVRQPSIVPQEEVQAKPSPPPQPASTQEVDDSEKSLRSAWLVAQRSHADLHPVGQGKSILHWHNRFRGESNLGNSSQNRQLLESMLAEVEEKAWLVLPLMAR